MTPRHAQVNLHCKDVGKMLDYLVDVLGFTPEFRARGPDGSVKFGGAWWGEVGKGTRVVLGDIEEALHGHYDHGEFGEQMVSHPLGTGVVLYFYTPDVDKVYARAAGKGAAMDEPPTDQFWGDRTISIITPEGYYFSFATPIPGFRFPPEFAKRLEDLRPRRKGARGRRSLKHPAVPGGSRSQGGRALNDVRLRGHSA